MPVSKNYTRNTTVIYNYATGGNIVNVSAVDQNPVTNGPIKDFIDQEGEFDALVESKSTSWNGDNSLFIAWFGINDVVSPLNNGLSYNDDLPVLDRDIGDYFSLLSQQYSLGARNFISILVPPIYRTGIFGYGTSPNGPLHAEPERLLERPDHSQCFQWELERTDITYNIVDPSETLNYILDHPTEVGASTNMCLCCPEGEPRLWADFTRPGVVIQDVLGNLLGPIMKGLGF